MNKNRIAITHGDINGIGYELILKTFAENEMLEMCTPIIYGSPKVATYHGKAINCPLNFSVCESSKEAQIGMVNMVNCFGETELKVDLAQLTSESGDAALSALDNALEDFHYGTYDALITAPCNNSVMQRPGYKFPGIARYLETKCGQQNASLQMYVNENLRIGFVTNKVPLSNVPAALTTEMLVSKINILAQSLKRDFSIDNPRIAVLALNPTTGDNGVYGKEENDVIIPAIKEANAKGPMCFGPYSVDELFGSGAYSNFDAILAMYHDQGAAAFKALSGSDGVLFTAGLPIIHTQPAIGTCFDITGKGIADETPMRHAIYLAMDIHKRRERYDEAHAHPLRRQYYDKRDDSDKLKLDQEE